MVSEKIQNRKYVYTTIIVVEDTDREGKGCSLKHREGDESSILQKQSEPNVSQEETRSAEFITTGQENFVSHKLSH